MGEKEGTNSMYVSGLLKDADTVPSRFEAMFISDAHTDDDIDRVIEAAKEFR